MPASAPMPDHARIIFLAGLGYLVIILAGLGAELGLRGPLIDLTDAERTAAAILSAPGQFRLAIAADIVMVLCDAGLAILFFEIFRKVAPIIALSAMVFRLIQAVLIAVSLLALVTAWLILMRADQLSNANALALIFLDLHAHGYDLGLVFFGVNSLMMAVLVRRSGLMPPAYGALLAIAGSIYLIGSGLKFFAPDYAALFAPAYLLTIVTETAFCLRLLAYKKQG